MGFNQIIISDINIKKINKCKYNIELFTKNDVVLYQGFSYNSIPENKKRVIKTISQESWVSIFKYLKFNYNFAPTTIMTIDNQDYVFVINNVKLCKDKLLFCVSNKVIDNNADNIEIDLPNGKFNNIRFIIDCIQFLGKNKFITKEIFERTFANTPAEGALINSGLAKGEHKPLIEDNISLSNKLSNYNNLELYKNSESQLRSYDQLLKSDILVESVDNMGNINYKITVKSNNDIDLYQVFNYNSIPINKNRLIKSITQKEWYNIFKDLQYNYNFAPMMIMEMNNELYAFVIVNVEIVENDLILFVSNKSSIFFEFENETQEIKSEIQTGEYKNIRLNIDGVREIDRKFRRINV